MPGEPPQSVPAPSARMHGGGTRQRRARLGPFLRRVAGDARLGLNARSPSAGAEEWPRARRAFPSGSCRRGCRSWARRSSPFSTRWGRSKEPRRAGILFARALARRAHPRRRSTARPRERGREATGTPLFVSEGAARAARSTCSTRCSTISSRRTPRSTACSSMSTAWACCSSARAASARASAPSSSSCGGTGSSPTTSSECDWRPPSTVFGAAADLLAIPHRSARPRRPQHQGSLRRHQRSRAQAHRRRRAARRMEGRRGVRPARGRGELPHDPRHPDSPPDGAGAAGTRHGVDPRDRRAQRAAPAHRHAHGARIRGSPRVATRDERAPFRTTPRPSSARSPVTDLERHSDPPPPIPRARDAPTEPDSGQHATPSSPWSAIPELVPFERELGVDSRREAPG